MTTFETFQSAAIAMADRAGVMGREFREASGPVAETEAMTAAMAHKDGALLLLGKPGSGKTLAATRRLLRPICNPANWLFCNGGWQYRRFIATDPRRTGELIWRTARSLARIQQYDQDTVEELFSARLLVLDDLGQEYLDKNGFLASLIDEIVTERHRRELPTLLTSNTTPAEFTERYGHRVLDRIVDTGRMVACDGDSLRRKPATDRPLPALITEALVAARIDEQEADRARQHREWRQREDAREASAREAQQARAAARAEPKPVDVPMTEAEVAARKAKITADLEAWAAKNPGASA